MATFDIKTGDTRPSIVYALTPTTVDLSGASVAFRYRIAGTTTWTTKTATVSTPTGTPTVLYNWQTGDTATPGFYEAEFVVTYLGGDIETFPNSEFITVNIFGDETGTSAAINNVRFLIGDTDSTDYAITNDNIAFALAQAGNDVYLAASICARALAAKYANLVDTRFESVSSNYSQLQDNYNQLAMRLERQSKKFAANGLGIPLAGGISISEIDSVESDTDRVPSKFRRDQYANPPRGGLEEGFGWV
jgi:hypothetical protein